jgi:hypothetical protein
MACCGNKRAQLLETNQTSRGLETSGQHQPERPFPVVYFQYAGQTGLTVIGRETGRRYRFNSPGAVVAVDFRDRRALAAIPSLRYVREAADVAKEI